MNEKEMRSHFEMRRQAFGQNLPNDFLLKYGRAYPIGPHTYRGLRDEPKNCFGNATHRALFYNRLTYVEGYTFVYGIPIEHAWLADPDGFAVDPTLTDNNDGRIGGYFGVPFITEYVKKATRANNSYGVLDYFYAGKTAPKLYELGLEEGQKWLLDQPVRRRRRKAVA
jgi:hypothetical protein